MDTEIKGKITKKLKSVEFGAENLDNMAPVQKILEDLQFKNDQAVALYCQTVRPRKARKEYHKTPHFTLAGHPLYAFPDNWDGDLNSGYFEPFLFKCLMPKIITQVSNIGKHDPVTEYLKVKRNWKDERKVFHKITARHNIIDKYESLNEEVALCPKHFVDMAAHLERDPDPHFNDTYNWYYAGHGNILLISIDWVDYLLHSVFNVLYLTQLIINDEYKQSLCASHTTTYDCGEDVKILEIICSSNNVIVLRTKNKVFILKIITSEDKLMFEKIKTVESEVPFTSISFDGHHKNILYITKLDNHVSIVNLDRLTARTVKLQSNNHSFVDNWSAVMSSDRVTYTHVARNSISIYDKRTNNNRYTWTGVRKLTDYITCNDITAAKQTDANSIYFTTDHHLFLLDLRYGDKSKPKVMQRWTHGMQCVPTYITVCNFENNKEIICLSSQWCEDSCVVPFYNSSSRGKAEIASVTMPYRLPSILTTLSAAREKLLCHDMYNPIDDRLSSSITGQMIIESGENYVIYVQNSLGDISCATLYPKHMDMFIDDDSIQHLHEWSQLYQLDKKQLEMSCIKDITNILRELKKVPQTFTPCNILKKKQTTNFNEKEINQIFENEELDSGLLYAWKSHNEITLGNSTLLEGSSMLNLYYSNEDQSE